MSRIKRIALAVFLASLLAILGDSQPTMAVGLEESPEFQKALTTSLSACYARGAFRDEITLASYGTSGGVNSVMVSTNTSISAPIPYGYTSSSVQLPSMSCSEILNRALSKKGISIPAKFEDAESVLTKIGYTKVTVGDTGEEKSCFWFEYDVNVDDTEWILGGGDYRTRDEVWRSKQVCLVEYTVDKEGGTTEPWTRLDGINTGNGGNSKILDIKQVDNTSVIKFQTQSFGSNDGWISLDSHRNGTAEDFMLRMYNELIATKHGRTGTGEVGSSVNRYTLKGYQDQSTPVGSAVTDATYQLQSDAAKTVPENLFGVTRLFDQTNTFIMYQNYLMKFYGAMTLEVDPNDPTQDSLRTGADKDLGGYSKIKVYNNGTVEECYVKPKKTSGKLYGVSNNRFGGIDATSWQYPSPVFQVSYDEIVRFLNGTSPSASELKSHSDYIIDASCTADNQQEQTKPSNPGSNGSNNSSGVTGGTSSDLAECLNGADSLGWVLCPVLNIVRTTVEGFYTDIEENWLPIEYNLLRTSSECDSKDSSECSSADVSEGDTAIYEAWKIFRNFANIAFSITLAVIIFSQLTGLGISNYGVKKMLPSLIIMAVLVNISFFICQLLVDVTNLVGAEIGEILEKIGKVASGGIDVTGGTVIKGAISVIFSAAGVGAAVVGGVKAIAMNPGLLIPVLIFGIGIIISLFFFFAILAIRKACIYVAIILAPLAIICYALPNTKNWFDKWKKLFTTLLFVYPICQALTGAGKMVSSIMLSQGKNSFMLSVVAVIISFAPIFLIPSLVRNSLALMGNIGAKMAQFGNRMRGTATGALNNSDMVKRARISGAYLGATKGRDLVNKVNGKLRNARGIGGAVRKIEDSRLGQLIGRQNARRDAQAKMAYRKMLMDDSSASNIAEHMNAESIQNDLASQEYKYRQDLISNAIDGMVNGHGIYTDVSGAKQAINTNDIIDLSSALDYYMSQYDATGDDGALLNAQALTRLLIESNGDKGRTAVMNLMKRRNFNATTGVGTRTASFDNLSQYINRDSKWMAGLKTADTGSFNMISDGARGGALENLHTYNTMGAYKITPASVSSLGDSFFDGFLSAQAAGKYDTTSANYDAAAADDLLRIRDAFRRTMADPMTAKDIKPDMLDEMNKINRQAYDIEVARGTSTGAYKDLAPGYELKVEHKKAAMPTGWRRANATEAAMYGTTKGFKEGEWIQGTGNGTSRLNATDTNRANAIEQQNINADIQNSL